MFTACVHDVQNGLLDLCVGDFWLTPERLELAPFTTPVTLEHLHLFAVSTSRCDTPFSPLGRRGTLAFRRLRAHSTLGASA